MEGFTTKQEEKLYKALETLLFNSVDGSGYPKKATVIQLTKADKALTNYRDYEMKKRMKENKDGKHLR